LLSSNGTDTVEPLAPLPVPTESVLVAAAGDAERRTAPTTRRTKRTGTAPRRHTEDAGTRRDAIAFIFSRLLARFESPGKPERVR
jgi:hypothetical protein